MMGRRTRGFACGTRGFACGARGLLFALACALWAPGALAIGLPEQLDAALAARALRGARIGALVVDEGGRVLYEREADRPLIPASNLKVLTSIAALRALGPAHRFVTTLFSQAPPAEDGSLQTLWVRGSGDPSLTSEDYWRLAADLRRAGVTRVRGDLVLDDSLFDGRHWHPSWGPTGSRAYHAPVSALTANYGAFAVTVAPGPEVGSPLRAVVDPPVPYLALEVRGRTGSASSRSSLVVDRLAGEGVERVIVSGGMPAGRESKTLNRSVLDATRYAGAVLRAQLEGLGIAVAGQTRVGPVPEVAVPVLEFEGPPLSDVVWLFMKYSNNQIGEALVKSLAAHAGERPATWERGSELMRAELSAMGLPLDGVVLVDGSGLSYENRVTPRLLVAALRAASRDFAIAPEFEAALPIASTDGTLEERAEATPGRLRAKTGLLTGVTALSGFALRDDGGRVVFSILVNGFRGGAEDAMDAVDGFAEALATSASSVAQERVGASP